MNVCILVQKDIFAIKLKLQVVKKDMTKFKKNALFNVHLKLFVKNQM